MAVQSSLLVKVSIIIDTVLNIDDDFDRYCDGDFRCKQTFYAIVLKMLQPCLLSVHKENFTD